MSATILKELAKLIRHYGEAVFWEDVGTAGKLASEAGALVEDLDIGDCPKLDLESSVFTDYPIKRPQTIVITTKLSRVFEAGAFVQTDNYKIRLRPDLELGYVVEVSGPDICGAHDTLRAEVRSAIKR